MPVKGYRKTECNYGHDISKPAQRYSSGGCKECVRKFSRMRRENNPEYMRNWRQENADRIREYQYGSPEAWVRKALKHAKHRATRKGREFSVTAEDLLPLPVECPGCRDPHLLWYGGGPVRNATASLDRLDSTRGYVPDNVWITCWRFNNVKGDATPDELYQVFLATQKELNCRQGLTLA